MEKFWYNFFAGANGITNSVVWFVGWLFLSVGLVLIFRPAGTSWMDYESFGGGAWLVIPAFAFAVAFRYVMMKRKPKG